MLHALGRGFSGLGRNWGLVVLVFAVNVFLAALLAVPLASQLDEDLAHTGASASMMYGFDYDWWKLWSEEQGGFARDFSPDVFGTGFVFRNVDLLLRGFVPAGLFPEAERDAQAALKASSRPRGIDPLILGLGLLYLLVQAFLNGGILGVLRAPRGGWTIRGVVHGSGFYFGRLLRVSLLALVLMGLVFAANVPFARWIDEMAREAVSERTALWLMLGRRGLLLVTLLLVHVAASYARVIVVLEDRQSAALALVTSAGFCGRHILAVLGQYAAVLLAGLLFFGAWAAADGGLVVVGWMSQLVAFALLQAFVLGRIGLRLGLLASQLELYRERRASP